VTGTRVVTAIILIPAVVAGVWWGSTGLVAAFVGLVTLLAFWEFFSLSARTALNGYRIWTMLCALALLFAQWSAAETQSWTLGRNLHLIRAPASSQVPLDFVFVIFSLGVAGIVLLSRRPLAGTLRDAGISAAVLLLIALPLSTLVRLDGAAVIGRKLVLFTLVLVWAGDMLAYFVGRGLGRTHLAPQLSPNKTWEGAAGNLFGSLAVAFAFSYWLPINLVHVVAMAALANIAGQAGDLLESAYKRSAGVKDSGTLLPGHGGVLDRIDALILSAPVVWYYFEFVLSSRA